MDFQDYLEEFYARYKRRADPRAGGILLPAPRSTTLISRSVL
ncbi:chromosome partitioning protein MukE, partial [Klebsiella pneumoniae]